MSSNFLTRFVDKLNLMDFHDKREEFYEELAASIQNKEQLKVFLEEELKISRHKKTRNTSRESALKIMLRRLGSGEDYRLSRILGSVMPQSDRLMMSALDSAKDKPATLRALARAIKEQKEARNIITKAVIPPMILVPGVAGFSYILSTQSIPVIASMAPDSVWTPYNKAVRDFAFFVSDHGLTMVTLIVLAISLFIYALPRWKGRIRSKLEQISGKLGLLLFPICPLILPLGIYREFQVTLLLTSLAVLLQAGHTLTESLDLLKRNSSPWMRWHLKKIESHLNVAPTDYVPAFAKGLMSPHVLAKVATTIRNNPKFDQILIKLGTDGSIEIRNEISKTSKGLNTVLMALAGVVVLFLYVGQLSISNTLSDELSNPGATQTR